MRTLITVCRWPMSCIHSQQVLALQSLCSNGRLTIISFETFFLTIRVRCSCNLICADLLHAYNIRWTRWRKKVTTSKNDSIEVCEIISTSQNYHLLVKFPTLYICFLSSYAFLKAREKSIKKQLKPVVMN